MEPKILHFFLGATSAQGFVSRFDQLADPEAGWRCHIIKGGPGTGKSSLMSRLSCQLGETAGLVEHIHCSSDADSLDGVIFPRCKLSIADGTSPHVLEPRYPGAWENVVSLCDCWDKKRLSGQRDEIMALSKRISSCHKSAAGYLHAAGSLLTDLRRTAGEAVDVPKIVRYAQGVAGREFSRSTGHAGHESIRLLSAITNKGPVLFNETVLTLAPRLYVVEDHWGVAAPLVMEQLRDLALAKGYDVISCPCPLFPFSRLDHLFLPELGLGFVTSSPFHSIDAPAFRVIHAQRFLDKTILATRKHRLSFLQRAARNMVEEASATIAQAKFLHDQLEGYYIAAMDFDRVGETADKVLAEFRKEMLEQDCRL